jgi:hypothetical protein
MYLVILQKKNMSKKLKETETKKLVVRNDNGQLKKGYTANPNGRPKDSNYSKLCKQKIFEAWNAEGDDFDIVNLLRQVKPAERLAFYRDTAKYFIPRPIDTAITTALKTNYFRAILGFEMNIDNAIEE